MAGAVVSEQVIFKLLFYDLFELSTDDEKELLSHVKPFIKETKRF